MPGHIFISYCHCDGDFAENLATKLKENGLEIWMDESGLAGGDEWREEIDKNIRDSSALVLVVTEESKKSFYVTYEWIFALGAGLKVIPIKLKEADLHPRLREIHYHDFTNRNARPWDKLIADLKDICAKGQRKKSDTIAEAKQSCSIEIPFDCPPIIEKAIMTLDSVTIDERRNAIRLLAQYNQPSSTEVLLSAMKKHPLYDVRSYIASVLGETGNKVAVPGLIEALRDTNYEVRRGAAFALGGIGDKVAVPGLIEALRDTNCEVREGAAFALGEIGDKVAVPVLIEALRDTNHEVRRRAASALCRNGDKVALSVWIEALKDTDDEVRRWAAFALGEIGDRVAVPGLIEASKDADNLVRINAIAALAKIGDKVPAVAFLRTLKDPDREVRKGAAEALEKFGIKSE